MKRYTVLSGVLIICVVGIVATLTLPWAPPFVSIKSHSADAITYDSGIRTPVYHATETMRRPTKDFSATIEFQAYRTRGYTDLFQTAPANTGIRAELHGQTLGVIIAAHNPQGFVAYPLTGDFKARSHLLEITIKKNNHVSVVLDRQPVVNESVPQLDYAISNITVGSGFSKDRFFNGRIDDFRYSYGFYEPNTSNVVPWVRIVLAILGVAALLLLVTTADLRLSLILPGIAAESDTAVM